MLRLEIGRNVRRAAAAADGISDLWESSVKKPRIEYSKDIYICYIYIRYDMVRIHMSECTQNT